MSHYTRVRTQINDRQSLVNALKDMGFTADQIQVHDEAVNLEGYAGDKRADKANIVIPRRAVGGAANDIGFIKTADGSYEAIVSDYDRGNRACRKNDLTKNFTGYNGDWLKKVNQRYTFHKISKEVSELGYDIAETVVGADGKIKMQCVSAYSK